MRPLSCLLLLLLYTTSAFPQEANLDVVHRIKTEAFDNSKVMDTLSYLSDIYGPRLTGSPEFGQAADWTLSTLKQYGLANVHSEKWGPFGRSWSLQGYTIEMTSPRYSHLIAMPLAWSAPTHGIETGEILVAPFRMDNPFDIPKGRAAFQDYKKQWAGKLKGKVVFVSEDIRPSPTDRPLFTRYTDAQLADIAKAPEPSMKRNIPIDEIKFPAEQDEAQKYFRSLPNATADELLDRYFAFQNERGDFYRTEGAAAVILSDRRAHNGLLFAEAAGSEKAASPLAVPTFVVTQEQYSRMLRLVEKKQPVSLRFAIDAKVSSADVDGLNLSVKFPAALSPTKSS